jgi:hypothetical protein
MSAPKPTLAVISTFDDLCGIAGYTKPIVGLLAGPFDITVFDLPAVSRSGRRVVNESTTGSISLQSLPEGLLCPTVAASGGGHARGESGRSGELQSR